ncbi:MAG: HIT family protein [Niameybacter sp.]
MKMHSDCIFCKILKGDIPSFVVYEDEYFKVILDRFPASRGHVLILPKAHYQDMFELPVGISARLYPLANHIAKGIKEAVQAEGINVIQNNGEAAGQSVFHFHMHLIPRFKNDQVVLNKTSNMEITLEELAKTAELIKSYL